MKIIDIIVPFIILFVFLYGIIKKINIVDEFVDGAKAGLKTSLDILPALILLMTAVEMFTKSGADNALAELISPITNFLGFPKECVSLAIVRQISGSGALAVFENVLNDVSPDSFAGLTASIFMGSTETVFYTITIYFSELKKKADIRIFISAIAASITSMIFSVVTARIMF